MEQKIKAALGEYALRVIILSAQLEAARAELAEVKTKLEKAAAANPASDIQ